MFYYKENFVQWLIRERAQARRDRHNYNGTNADALRPYLPFPEWLRFMRSVEDWHAVKPYKLWCYFTEYQVDCVSASLEWEDPKQYGLYNCLP